MKKAFKLILVAALCLTAASCSKSVLDQMAMAENVQIVCDPTILEAYGDDIPVTVSVTYPEGYFHRKATMEVTPVIVYDGGEQSGATYKYQGEAVKDNYKVIPVDGGTVKESMNFKFVKGMEKCSLELRAKVNYNDQSKTIEPIKIAEGCRIVSRLVNDNGALGFKECDYQEIIKQSAEGQILYDKNSANVKKSELKGESVKNFLATVDELKDNDRVSITGTEIVAYASPEGGQSLNAKLSDKRASSAKEAWDKLSKDLGLSDPDVKSVGQDWEGFQKAVAASDIEEKDLILRVLSMYSDPAVRESEIKNMSQVFTELKKDVLPELRRARFIANVDFKNLTEDELKQYAETNIGYLREDGLLKLGEMDDNLNNKAVYYRLAADKYNSQSGLYNLASTYIQNGNLDGAKVCLDRLADQEDPDVVNARGVIAMKKGNYDEAVSLFKQADNEDSKVNLGTVELLKGNYDKALKQLAGTESSNTGLAYILSGDYDKAMSALTGDDATTDYLKAVVSSRLGKVSDAKAYLKSAFAKDSSLKERAQNDIEFANFEL